MPLAGRIRSLLHVLVFGSAVAVAGCNGDDTTDRTCSASMPCQPGEVCGDDGVCRAVTMGNDGGMSVPDAGPGGPPYKVRAQTIGGGASHGMTGRYQLESHVGSSAPNDAKSGRYQVRGGIVGGGTK